jgi:hypothetical protein
MGMVWAAEASARDIVVVDMLREECFGPIPAWIEAKKALAT